MGVNQSLYRSVSGVVLVLALLVGCTSEASPVDPSATAADNASASSTTTEVTEPVASQPSTTETPETTLPPLDPSFESLEGISTISDFSGFTSSGMDLWVESVPGIEEIEITSTADDSSQPALWLSPEGDDDRPLLVILHSWSSGYLQHAGIPYAMWAQENGWGVIAPEFRGINDDAEALGSDLAVQDVVDAIDYATGQDGVSSDRVFAVGYSGGGMMSLLLAGRHPEKVTAVAAWGPPYDLEEFYRQSLDTGLHYAADIQAGCGGDPTDEGSDQEDECLERSPMTHLDAAREEGVAVYIGHGISDSLLSPAHAARAFNQLANPDDHIEEEALESIAAGSLPDDLSGSVDAETFFADGDPDPVFARTSDSVTLVFFAADHEMVYGATARFFASDPG